ncbi:MAG: hypothetical protein AAGA58_06985 [Verrucomicrobiota bacterium]
MGFLDSMSTESSASSAIEESQRTKLVAQGAIAHAIDILRTNIPDPSQLSEAGGSLMLEQDSFDTSNQERPRPFEIEERGGPIAAAPQLWITNPGQLSVLLGAGGAWERIPLHTGEAQSGSADGDLQSYDLNAPLPGETTPVITGLRNNGGATPQMRIAFMNVLDDPSSSPGQSNQIVARYAFWLDDESTKLNFNVANGKPDESEPSGQAFKEQLEGGMVTPFFSRGTGETNNNQSNSRGWSLGHPRSVNFDVLFDDPSNLNHDDLLDHVWIHGFNRYPEAIKKFTTFQSESAKSLWYDRNKFDLTSYSRAPEFNVFGRSRFFTTHHPLSLEAGPSYQQVFVYDGSPSPRATGNEVLNLNGLYGNLGWTHEFTTAAGHIENGGSLVNRLQLQMLMRYMYRDWPGYTRSFVDKYGEEGAFQICLNLLNLARFATTGMSNKDRNWPLNQSFSHDWSLRTTSVSYIPAGRDGVQEMRYDSKGENHRHPMFPEDSYWRLDTDGQGTGRNGEHLFIPQSPGPHITEVGIEFRVKDTLNDYAGLNPRNEKKVLEVYDPNAEDPGRMDQFSLPRHIEYRIVGELTATPQLPPLRAEDFTLHVDRLRMHLRGSGLRQYEKNNAGNRFERPQRDAEPDRLWNRLSYKDNVVVNLGVYRTVGNKNTTDWKKGSAGGRLTARAPVGSYIAGPGMENSEGDKNIPQRVRLESPWRPVGEQYFQVPSDASSSSWRPAIFDARLGSRVAISKIEARFGMGIRGRPNQENENPGIGGSSRRTRQMIPLGEADSSERRDTRSEIAYDFDEEDLMDDHVLEWTESRRSRFDQFLNLRAPADAAKAGVFWEIEDPNLSAHKDQWTLNESIAPGSDTIGLPNSNEPGFASSERSKQKYIQRGTSRDVDNDEYHARWNGHSLNSGDEYWSRSRTSSKGFFWSFIHTGMKEGGTKNGGGPKPWQTFNLGAVADRQDPPDYVLLDLIGATYPMQHQQWENENALPDSFSTVSFMNSTAGQVNINSRIYPQNPFFNPPPRIKPVEGVFKHLRSESDVAEFAQEVSNYQSNAQYFEYIGELAEVQGYASGTTDFEKESFLRNMAGCLTTKSNTFGMWGVAQSVRKSRANQNYGEMEEGDQILAEKRFFAIIERYIWPGKDGVPGNAHVSAAGVWDRIAKQNRSIALDKNTDRLFQLPGSPPLRRGGENQTNVNLNIDQTGTYPEYDGPQPVGMDESSERVFGKVEWESSTLEDAYNPPQAVVKYRVVYFKYLDD